MLSSPYSSLPYHSNRVLTVRVSPTDIDFLETLLPFRSVLFNPILATLFHAFITELRRLNAECPLPAGHHPLHPTYILIEELLRRISFVGREEQDGIGAISGPPPRLPDGPSPGGDVPRSSGSLCSTLLSPSGLSPDEESGSDERGREPRRREENQEKRQRELSDGDARETCS